jgi:hypothetical protein
MTNTQNNTITLATRANLPNNAVRGGMKETLTDVKTGEQILVCWFQRDGVRVFTCLAKRSSDFHSVLLGTPCSAYGRARTTMGKRAAWCSIPGAEASRILTAAGVNVCGFHNHQVSERV